jgi:hypothetical protein
MIASVGSCWGRLRPGQLLSHDSQGGVKFRPSIPRGPFEHRLCEPVWGTGFRGPLFAPTVQSALLADRGPPLGSVLASSCCVVCGWAECARKKIVLEPVCSKAAHPEFGCGPWSLRFVAIVIASRLHKHIRNLWMEVLGPSVFVKNPAGTCLFQGCTSVLRSVQKRVRCQTPGRIPSPTFGPIFGLIFWPHIWGPL